MDVNTIKIGDKYTFKVASGSDGSEYIPYNETHDERLLYDTEEEATDASRRFLGWVIEQTLTGAFDPADADENTVVVVD